ncbi:MAG TPA: glycosyltransferase family 39 protein [Solirubrobacteraceae bacterium]|nr:glycosyltransferase family 39 protein [Solirubrobacteraceae bacterium]
MAISARAEAAGPRGRGQGMAAVGGRYGSTAFQAVVALTVIGAALRFATIDVQSLWLDESATVILVHRSFSGMLSHLSSSESAPPLYYVLAWLWTHVFGTGAIGFRSLSALAGTLTIPVVFACGREVSERTGLWAATLATFSPAMYYYSQEARAYSLLIFFGALAFWCWLRALRIGDGRSLAWWAGTSALAVLTHYFAAFLFIPEALLLIRRMGLRRVLAPVGAVCLVGLALAPLAISQRSDGKAKWIEESSLLNRIAETVKQFLVGLYGPVEIGTAVVSGLIGLALLALAWQRADGRERGPASDAAIVAAAAIGLPLVLAGAHIIDVFDGRNVIAAWVPYAVVLALGAGAARAGRAGAALGASLCAVGIGVIVATNLLPGYQRDDWRGVASALPATQAPRAIVAERYAGSPLSIYLHQTLRGPSGGRVLVSELDFATLRVRRTEGAPTPPAIQHVAPAGFRLVAVSSHEAYAVTRFVADRPTEVPVRELLRLSGDPGGEVLLTR